MISTCGHKIHDNCLSENIGGGKQAKEGFGCFLCSSKANFIMPVELKENDKTIVSKVYQNMLAVISFQSQQNSQLGKYAPKEKQVNRLLIRSLTLMVYYYPTCADKLFTSKILPVLDPTVALIRAFKKHT